MNNFFRYRLGRYKYYLLTLVCTTMVIYSVFLIQQARSQPEQARSADAFVDSIGVVTHLRYLDTAYGNYNEIIKPKLKKLGVRHIRDDVSLEDLTTQTKLNELATFGIKSTLIMDTRWQETPANAVVIAKAVDQSVEAVEGPNEWDVHDEVSYQGETFPTGLRNFQADLYAAIKGDPATAHLDVLSPSVAHWWNAAKLGNVSCDLGTMHSYPGGNEPTWDLDSKWITATRLICGSKPIVATECGWHNATDDEEALHPGVSEQAAGKYVPRMYLEYFNRDIKRAFIYEFINEWSGTDQESNFGLLRNDGSPKPAFNALKNLITLLKDPGESFSPQALDYTLSGNISNVHHTLLQKRNGQFYLILWQEVPSFDLNSKTDISVPEQQVTLTLKTPIKRAITYQPINSTTRLKRYKRPQQLNVSVPDHPLMIKLVPA
ncbi:MAG: hypothetical protein F6K31_05520 [Symploca sp. SIO2G7]|nr:hypothetical protein [Symploca sp. SIO2G7]